MAKKGNKHKKTMKPTSTNRNSTVPMGGAVAVIVGVIIGVVIILGGGVYFASRQLVEDQLVGEQEIVVAAIAPVIDYTNNESTYQTSYTSDESTYQASYTSDESTYQASYTSDESTYHTSYTHVASPYTTITISAAGCTTLGGDARWAGYHRFMYMFNNAGGTSGGHSFFLQNVCNIFYESDLSILNLEGTLTYATEHMDKEFVFRGPPHFAQILTYGNIDVVSIANNHTIDFFDRGYQDTRRALYSEGIAYFGNEFNLIKEVNGIYVGLFGFRVWNPYAYNRNRITAAVEDLRARGAQLVIAYHHWGTENTNMVNEVQRTMGRWTVEAGADLVLGSHPHVIQGIETYQGVNIIYSLANFSFGGNSNPPDQDSFIFQQTFTFRDGELIRDNETNIIPVRVSSTRAYNNFQPTVALGDDGERILRRIRTYSEWLE